jgi:hypothetical protein
VAIVLDGSVGCSLIGQPHLPSIGMRLNKTHHREQQRLPMAADAPRVVGAPASWIG